MAADEVDVGDNEIEALMRLVHYIEARHQERPTSQLDLRARIIIQQLGLEGETSVRDLRERLRLSPSTLTSLADRLEKAGYVKRNRYESDRRTVMLSLTATGQKAYEAEKDFYRHLITDSLAHLSTEARSYVMDAWADALGARQNSQVRTS